MYSFKNDYSEGAHEKILESLLKCNLSQSDGYGEDEYCKEAKRAIMQEMNCNEVDIHFLVGGTQTNLTAISAFLKSYEAVVAPSTGHVLTHETGAIEATGHKVISIPSLDGKIRAEEVKAVVDEHIDEHMVKPRMVYISQPTEVGTIYNKKEIESLKKVCEDKNLIFYIDGARLASALTCEVNDLSLEDICKVADAFYIGGTKCGAYLGEALVIKKNELKENFRYNIKQRGALLAKGRLIGIQFRELFKDNLYYKLGEYANSMAMILKNGLKERGYNFLVETYTNQIFPILAKKDLERLREKYDFVIWSKIDEEYYAIRLVTSWATKKEKIEVFLKELQ